MTRPNSKYFASVITKLIAAKRKENIVIDESFKMQLRSELLTHTASLGQPEKAAAGDFFKRWRYAFALVPSALVVMIVAAQFLDMPVSVPTEQKTESDIQEEISSIDSEPTELASTDEELALQEDADDAEMPSSSLTQTKRLKTLPGALVMPNYLLDEENETYETLASDVSEDFDETSVAGVMTSPSGGAVNLFEITTLMQHEEDTTSSHREEKRILSDDDSNDTPSESEVQSSSKPKEEGNQLKSEGTIYHVPEEDDETGDLGGGEESSSDGQDQPTEEDDVPDEPAVPSEEAPNPPVEATFVPPLFSVEDDAEKRIDATPTASQISVPLSDRLRPVYPVDYDVDMNEARKSVLESVVIPSLVNGNEVAEVEVFEKEKDIVAVEVIFKDGSSVLRYYTYNENTDVWDKVRYVTNFYYDDAFSYSTNLQYTRLR